MIRISIAYYYFLLHLISVIYRLFAGQNWKQKGLEKKRSVESLIPAEWLLPLSVVTKISETSASNVLEHPRKSGILNETELHITEDYTACQLLTEIREGRFTAIEVTTAFCKRAAIAHQLTNCCTEFMFDMAFKRAQELDDHFKKTGETIGPLHGLPISLKDTFNIPGYDSTIGFVSFIGNGKNIKENSNIVTMLLDLGAVLYVKTNVPQTLMTPDTDNHVMGRCLNPLNTSLTSGGSSGGEASLILQRGSLLGIGTDVGGSLRIPSLCCGTYALKPGTNRLPYGKQTSPGLKDAKGFGISSVMGPIATCSEDLELLTKNVILKKPWEYDDAVIPLPWCDKLGLNKDKKLRIGVIIEDQAFPVHPPIKRTLQESIAKLGKDFELVILNNHPSYLEMWKCCLNFYTLSNNWYTAKDLCSSGEPPIKSLSTNGAEVFGLPPVSLEGASQLVWLRKKFIAEWNQVFIDHKIDLILSPASPSTAPPHDTYGAVPYTAAWNLIDFPCTIIPYGKIDEVDTKDLWETKSSDYNFICAQYDQLKYIGGKGHLQLTCRYTEEEKLLHITKEVDRLLKI